MIRSRRWWWPPIALAAAAMGLVGFRRILESPELVDIPVFTDLLTERGVPLIVLTWTLLIMPSVLAMGAAVWIYAGAHQFTFPLFFGLGLVGLFLFQGGAGVGLAATWGPLGASFNTLFLMGATLVFLQFPNGRFVPRWSWFVWLAALVPLLFDITLAQDLRRLFIDPEVSFPPNRLWGVGAIIALIAFMIAAQAVRYRRHSTPIEQLQTRWVLVGGMLTWIPAVLGAVLNFFVPGHLLVAWLVAVTALSSYAIPVACAVAVTKYRLYDLGRVVSRTVSYTLVAGAVGLLYIGGVGAVRLMFPLSGSLAVAASTLAVVALVTPLHRRIRIAIERRFNRARFDAEVESAAFSSRLQSALNIDDLLADIVHVLAKTVQPSSAAVWMSVITPSVVSDRPRLGARGDSPHES